MQEKPRIVFMGTPEFASTILKKLVDEGFPVLACVTAPDKPAGRGRKIQESDVKKTATALALPILQPERLKEEQFIANLKQLNADIYIVVAFRMLPKEVWELPKLGTINLHGSLLPAYRGAAPINWAIINGETETGVTTFFINEKIDTGDILLQKTIPIVKNETAGSLHDKMMHVGANLVVETINKLYKEGLTASKQENVNANFKPAPKIFKNDCKIDFNKTTKELANFIHGLSPYPGAWLTLVHLPKQQEKTFKLFECEEVVQKRSEYPKLTIEEDNLILTWNNGSLKLLAVQLEGKKRLAVKDFLSGFSPEDWEVKN